MVRTDPAGRAHVGPGGGPVVHPRLHRRRIEVKRQEGRRRLRFLVTWVALAAMVGGAFVVTRSPLLDVDRVDVRGAERTPPGAVRQAAGLGPGALMVEVDLGRVARAVETLPWVLDAETQRSWPGTVVVEVTERTPTATVVAASGGWAVLDGSGRVLEIRTDRQGGLPALEGVSPAGPPGSALHGEALEALRVVTDLPPGLRPRVAAVARDRGGTLELRLGPPGGVVRLGSLDRLEAKLTAALIVLEKASPARVGILDVGAPDTPVLTRR